DLQSFPPDGGKYGTCAGKVSAGSSCASIVSSENPCVFGSFCPSGGPNCIAVSSAGGPCGGGAANATRCKSFLDCFHVDGGNVTSVGVCRLPADAGQACGAATTMAAHGISCNSESFPAY